ncbi:MULTISPECIES: AtpZ/AtpI family protein [Chlorobium/Pelodictyon group]|uniref:F0F1-ATPase subunit, putative n=1 Tax=Chlorobium luteolum (strain DSM 273 / BCRC 81028 / 2530) TaxID=319225 RepID=Q3B404_CHLL3|nr:MULTISPECIES: AtpZ/AtpI family protein [Chlorobium/Pelodictyon group]ABB23927.1 F0F1-ATPase subunit, putative [Pelodictyon luteolum DSM 273]TCD47403.1 F0F1 ATP synthase subunit [Chlorobium sp. N1]
MTERPEEKGPLSKRVGSSEQRKLKARKRTIRNIWFGFSLFGLIGWSIVIPTLAGVAIGLWIDSRYPSGRSWALMLLVAGLAVGCWNAVRWMLEEKKEMEREERDDE